MEVVINIPDEAYKACLKLKGELDEDNSILGICLINSVINGTQLPKEHGVLKDTSEIEQIICTLREKLIITGGMANLIRDVYLQAKTIVDANKTE